ncbi:serine hydrolase [Lentimicrobium sp. S6]|uniref:serine hydrolase domain-containing protein n=1 Tax=Lentimicrobium sp. S6 TaxID=2735872 RepID=UPI001554AECD|nr:serine hydrolase [Lentimicrobium sp. S6]NPD46133.1 serine hydrolase [Lentimicrobium sp. S6]
MKRILNIVFTLIIIHPMLVASEPLDYWPTKAWKTSTPEVQGMDSEKLSKMMEYYQKHFAEEEKQMIESVAIIRNGYIVADIYTNPNYNGEDVHIINSCTKSIMSALVGIAIEKGFIESVNTPIVELLDTTGLDSISQQLRMVSLKDLLSMQTGWHARDSYVYQWVGLFEMQKTSNWTQHVLNRSFETNPGERFEYSNMASYMLSAIIAKNTGLNTLDFAKKYLFSPLGIDEVRWDKSPEGVYVGFARMWLKPHDMAKIGHLYLHKGLWDGQQIISEKWIEESTTVQSFPKKYRYVYTDEMKVDYGTSGGLWLMTRLGRPFTDGYGYQWWLGKDGSYAAVGVGGQFIMNYPKYNLTVVFTSKLKGVKTFFPYKMFKKFIVASIKSDSEIAPNSTAYNKLLELSMPIRCSNQQVKKDSLPSIAKSISGKTFILDTNPWNYSDLEFQFNDKMDYANIRYSYKHGEKVYYRISLTDSILKTKSGEEIFIASGTWTSETTFIINYERVGYSSLGQWEFTFTDENTVNVKESGQTGVYIYKGICQVR